MKNVKISVVIPVKNGAATLGRCLKSLRDQTIGNCIEIIVLDSMSTDDSREIAARFNTEIVSITAGTFNHGLTRNIGVHKAVADLVYFTVQDAWIAETDMLERMAAHFDLADVMGAVGHQAVPHEKDKNPVLWRKTFSKPVPLLKRLNHPEGLNSMKAGEQRRLIAWDNVVAMYRKTALLQLPFKQTEFAEDWIWSHQALLKGWALKYDPSLVVYHYHHGTFAYTFRVHYTINYHFYRYFHFLPSVPAIIRPVAERSYHLVKNRRLSIKEKLFWILHNVGILTATKLSVLNFLLRLKFGGMKEVEKGLQRYCGKIPQGKQNMKSLI